MSVDLSEVKLAELLGHGGMRDYADTYESARPALHVWLGRLGDLSDTELFGETRMVVAEAAVANNRGPWRDVSHVKVAAAMNESKRRWAAASHAEDCKGTDLYNNAWAMAARDLGHDMGQVIPCSCDVGSEESAL